MGIRRRVCAVTVSALMLVCASPAVARQNSSGDTAKPSTSKSATTTTQHKASSAGATKSSKTHTASTGKRSRRKSAKLRGQQKIDSERAQAIQEALIREHYMTGEATGKWNESCEAAMRKYQADHGWQSKTVPDSRALISLGLGPSKDHLLNPESAMTTVPDAPNKAKTPSVDPSAPNPTPADPARPQ